MTTPRPTRSATTITVRPSAVDARSDDSCPVPGEVVSSAAWKPGKRAVGAR